MKNHTPAVAFIIVIVVIVSGLAAGYFFSVNKQQTSITCAIAGQPAGIRLRVAFDTNQTPVVGAQVYATHREADDYCNGVLNPGLLIRTSFITNATTNWESLDSTNGGTYTFMIVYSNQKYSFSAQLQPISMTCATSFVPSGRLNVTVTEFKTTCP